MTVDLKHDPERACAQIFNSAIAAAAISAAWDVGVFDELRSAEQLNIDEFAVRRGLDTGATRAVFAALADADVVRRSGGHTVAGPNFAEADRTKGFFYWLTRGYGELFGDLPRLLRQENRSGHFYRRDGAAIGIACRQNNEVFFDPTFQPVLDSLDFSEIADLGCGSGERLIRTAQQRPGVRGIGIDLSDDVLGLARDEVRKAGLAERITLVKADVTALEEQAAYARVDLVTSFMMGHDFWPRERCIASFRRLREVFPEVRHFLLADTARTTGFPDGDMPIFSLGFETAHAVMGVYLPTLDEWEGVFGEAGWSCAGRHLIDTPAASFMFHLVPSRR
jgi:phenylpyruvate C(3)-methyltransferase